MYAEQEAETRVRNFKAQYEAKYREVNEQKEILANREKELDEKEANIEKNVSNEVGYIRNELDKKNSNTIHCMHSSLEQLFIAF